MPHLKEKNWWSDFVKERDWLSNRKCLCLKHFVLDLTHSLLHSKNSNYSSPLHWFFSIIVKFIRSTKIYRREKVELFWKTVISAFEIMFSQVVSEKNLMYNQCDKKHNKQKQKNKQTKTKNPLFTNKIRCSSLQWGHAEA